MLGATFAEYIGRANTNQGRDVLRRKPSQVVQAGKRTNTAGKPIRNKILLAMTDAEFHMIRSHLEYAALPSHFRLHESHQTFKFVYFPNEGLISLVVAMAN